jgi:hypothetical protein
MDNPDVLETSFNDDLEKLAKSKHCYFCSKLWKNMSDFYGRLPYDLVNDTKKRQDYGKNGALCAFHLWQLASMASNACLSLVLAEIAQETSRGLSELVDHNLGLRKKLGLSFNPKSKCLVCSYAGQTEMQYLNYFRKAVAKREGFAAYEKSKGFCLRHAVLIIDGMDEECSKYVILHAVKRFSELCQNLLNFSQKTKMRRKDLIQPDEQYAVSRALIQLGGTRYLHYLLMD